MLRRKALSEAELSRIISVSGVSLFSTYYIITSILHGSLHFIPFHQLEEEFARIGEKYESYRPILSSMQLANRIGLHSSFILIICGIILWWEQYSFFLRWWDYSQLILLFIFFVFLFHFIPFYLGRLLSTRALMFFFPALKIQYYFFFPLVKILQFVHTSLEIFVSARSDKHDRIEHEIRAVVTGGEQAGFLKERDAEMITSIVEFKEEDVTKIMIPRTKMVAIEENASFEEAIQTIQETKYSRYPVYQQTRDKITGILYTKDLFLYWNNTHTPPLAEIMRKAFFIPESKRIRDLLNDFIQRRQLIAVVLDEFGGTTGIVTLKDILGRIVGEAVEEEVAPHLNMISPTDSGTPTN